MPDIRVFGHPQLPATAIPGCYLGTGNHTYFTYISLWSPSVVSGCYLLTRNHTNTTLPFAQSFTFPGQFINVKQNEDY